MSDIFDYEMIDIDLKENIHMQYDLECHQNDTIKLNFIIRDMGKLVDLSQYKIELMAKKPDGTDYIQDEPTGITKDNQGNLTIGCKQTLTNFSGLAKCQLRLWNKVEQQSSTRVMVFDIKQSALEIDRGIHESTITKLEELLNALNIAKDLSDEFTKEIEEALKAEQKFKEDIEQANKINKTLVNNTNTANSVNTTLVKNTDVANITNTTLINNTNIANEKITTLNEINTTADKNITNLTKQNDDGTKNITDLTKQNNDALTNKSELEETITNATNKITEVKTNISNADKSKEALDLSKINGDATNKDLNDAIVIAKESIEEIKHLDTTHIVQDVGDIKQEIKEARGEFPNLNDRITEAENSGGFFMSETLPEIADRKSTILYKKILKRRDV
ncbi:MULTISPECIES: BppU family phage baseplate upper protein [unclassified Clostridium]|uniref:BppU family phage baseplate upper protein n=1 Tax=unclassified Clostridium TaxID=2614128 RepID=UPI00207A21E7|nr:MULTISPECIES: BppU family phage baseplate upper protein [unclassified Clostridium]